MTTLTYSGRLTVVFCWCGIRHAVPEELSDFQQRQHADGERVTSIYCPLGHTHIPAGPGEAEKLRQEKVRLLARLDQAQASRQRTERQLSAAKGQATKLRKRAANGICPCCNRQFVNVERHMTTKHPGYGDESNDEVPT